MSSIDINEIEEAIRRSDTLGQTLEQLNKNTDASSAAFEQLKDASVLLSGVLFDTDKYLINLGKNSSIGSSNIGGLADAFKSAGAIMNGIISVVGKSSDGLMKKFGEVFSFIENMGGQSAENTFKNIQLLEGYENKLSSILGKSAGFGADESRLDFIKNSGDEIGKFRLLNTDLANALGITTNEMESYTFKLMEIPGAYKATVDVGGQFGGTISLNELAMRAARGTTGDFDDALQSLVYTYDNFGEVGKSSIDLLTATYDVSQKLGVKFDDLQNEVVGVSDKFKFFGDNTKSSVNIVNSLGSALKETGLGFKSYKEIINSVTGGIENLSIGQKAFLSQRTGGAGGLRGALQIEELMANGQIDQVYGKVRQELMNQFGGRVVTREEGSKSDTAAAQYAKQVQLLTSGPLGGLVKDAGQAAKLLEVFSKGTDLKELNKPEGLRKDTTAAALTADNAIQGRQSNVLNVMNNQIETTQFLAKISQGDLVRNDYLSSSNQYLSGIFESLQKSGSARATDIAKGQYKFKGSGKEAESMASSLLDTGDRSVIGLSKTLIDYRDKQSKNIKKMPMVQTPSGPITKEDFDKKQYTANPNTIQISPVEIYVNVKYPDGSMDRIKQVQSATVGTLGNQ